MNATTLPAGQAGPQDKVSKILVWILLMTTVACWIGMAFATRSTYRQAAPLPQKMVSTSGTTVMTRDDIVAGKSGFQKADLMDYGSLYGMGSYFGEDYTAEYLVQLAQETRNNLALAQYGMPFKALDADRQSGITRTMRKRPAGHRPEPRHGGAAGCRGPGHRDPARRHRHVAAPRRLQPRATPARARWTPRRRSRPPASCCTRR